MEKEGTSTIKVFVRVRPVIASQKLNDKVVQVLEDNRTVKVINDTYNHMEIKFDQAFAPLTSQEDIYAHFFNVVPRVLDGYNVTIFAYGQTGSGKTYTMFGQLQNEQKLPQAITLDTDKRGVIPRTIEQIFQKVSSYKKASVFCTFLQIYNEKIYDLLQDSEIPKPLNIHESKVEGIFVEGLTQFGVQNSADCMELMIKGIKNRIIRQTSMNTKSSRSHSIFQLLLEIEESNGNYLKGRLNLCDLAGSEKINKREAIGDAQLKQLKNINLSLTTLGKVIYSLSNGDKKSIGAFRQSKLTRLLQQSLTGNTYTFVMANLSPSVKNLEETLNTLKFVERANHITLKVKQTQIANSNPDSMGKLQKQIDYLKQLLQLKKKGLNPQMLPDQIKSLRKQNQHLKNEYVPKNQLENLVKENRNMKKQIHNLQVQLQKTDGTQTSLQSGYQKQFRNKEKQDQMDKKYKLDYYMPSSRGEPSSRNSQDKRLSSSLIRAGNSIAMQNKRTIQDAPHRQREKKSMVQRLEELEIRKKNEEYRMIEEYEQYDKKVKGRYSPNKMLGNLGTPVGKSSGKREQSYIIKSRKKADYSDKIKQLQAKLFGK